MIWNVVDGDQFLWLPKEVRCHLYFCGMDFVLVRSLWASGSVEVDVPYGGGGGVPVFR